MKYILILSALLILFSLNACDSSSSDIPVTYDNLDALIDEGYAFYENGDYSSAVARFQSALERNVDPDAAVRAYQGLGWTYARVGEPSKAVNNFNFLIAAENIKTGRNPEIEIYDALATLDDYPVGPAISDTAGIGKYILHFQNTDLSILQLDKIRTYASYVNEEKIQVGTTAKIVEKGTSVITLANSPVSDSTGLDVSGDDNSSLKFNTTSNAEKDTFTEQVASEDAITEYYQYYLDADKGNVHIKPRYWDMKDLKISYRYHNDVFMVRNFNTKLISLDENMQDGSGIPTLSGGDVFYVDGIAYNTDPVSGYGSYYQADAYAGLAATFFTMNDYPNTVKSCHMVLLLNEYLKDTEGASYKRELYAGDDEIGIFEIYNLMALSYFKLKSYYHAERILEDYLYMTEITNGSSENYELELLEKLMNPDPTGWDEPDFR